MPAGAWGAWSGPRPWAGKSLLSPAHMPTHLSPQETPPIGAISRKPTLLPDCHSAWGWATRRLDNGDFCSRAEAGTLFHVATAERAGAGEWGPPGGASFLYVVATCVLAMQDLLRENWKGDTLQPDPASSALEKILFALVKFGDGPTPPSRSDQGAIPAVPRPRRPLPATPSAKS